LRNKKENLEEIMKKLLFSIVIILGMSLSLMDQSAWATNGSQMIGVGPVSRAMGGTGIANPQDGVSAIYLNPAAMSKFKKSQVDFGATLFSPTATLDPGTGVTSTSEDKPFAMPAVGTVLPLSDTFNLGLAIIGVGGSGVDYRGTPAGSSLSGGGKPTRVLLTQMDIIPALSANLMGGMLSLGLSLPVSYQTLDMANGMSQAYGVAVKLGVGVDLKILKLGGYFKTSLTNPKHRFIVDGTEVEVQAPTEFGLGASLTAVKNLVVSLDAKYIMWKSAKGYGENAGTNSVGPNFGAIKFDWKNQFVVAFGLQYDLGMIALRAGYNYGADPTQKKSTGFDGLAPAFLQHHITAGVGVDVAKDMQLNVGFVYALKAEGTIGTQKATIKATTIDIGLSKVF
jgi:long-chain fatty acid transport protein